MNDGAPRPTQTNRGPRLILASALALICCSAPATFASADEGFSATAEAATLGKISQSSSTAVDGGGGGLGTPDPPKVKDARCIERCLGTRKVTETGMAELSGRNLSGVVRVKLRGESGSIEVKPRKVTNKTLEFQIPRGARSGKPTVFDSSKSKSKSPASLKVKPESAIDVDSAFRVRDAALKRKKNFFSAKQKTQIDYLFEASGPTDIVFNVIDKTSGEVVESEVRENQQPFEQNSVTWDGLRDNGKVAANGKYKFEITQLSGGAGAKGTFKFYNHVFPLPAKHTYGDGLGAGRNHQGFDIFARCGKPILAARGGKVQTRAYHGSAGYYVVIDGAKTGADYFYAHLAKRVLVKKGQKVKTGQVIGYNDDTGNASGCHLHFEIWSAPGWYEGGRPIDAKKIARRWDKWS